MKKIIFSAMILFSVFSATITGCQSVSSVQQSGASQAVQPVVQTGTMPNFSQKDALNAIRNTIRLDYNHYSINLVNDTLAYQNEEYYEFQISGKEGAFGPPIIVSKENGAIYCYYADQTVSGVEQDKVLGSKI